MKKKWIILISICLVICLILGLSFISHTELRIKGEKEISINYQDEYIDEGYELLKCNLYRSNWRI